VERVFGSCRTCDEEREVMELSRAKARLYPFRRSSCSERGASPSEPAKQATWAVTRAWDACVGRDRRMIRCMYDDDGAALVAVT